MQYNDTQFIVVVFHQAYAVFAQCPLLVHRRNIIQPNPAHVHESVTRADYWNTLLETVTATEEPIIHTCWG